MPKISKTLLDQTGFAFIFIAFCYFAFGLIGTFFRIEPGFASAVWPAAGCAVVLVLYFGNKAYFPLFLGALCANLYSSGISLELITTSDLFWNAVRAFGALLQAVVSFHLLKKFCDFPLNLNSAYPLLSILLLISPVACLISASIGVTSLYLQGIIPFYISDFVWFTWWVGDSVGVLFFFPLLGILFPSKYFSRISNSKLVILVGIILLASVCFTFTYSKEVYKKNLNAKFSEITEKKIYELEVLKRQIESNLFALATLFRSGLSPTIDEFQLIAASLNDGIIPYRAIAWLDSLDVEQQIDWIKKQESRGLTNSKVKILDENRLHTKIFPIGLTAPYANNSLAIGIDLASHPVAGDTVFEAINARAIRATPPIRLAQQSDKETGNVIYYPVFNVEDEKLIGLAEIVIEVDKSLERLLIENNVSDAYDFSILDINSPSRPYVAGFDNNHLTSHDLHFSKSYELIWFGRKWLVNFESTNSFENTKKDWLSWLTLIVGFIVAALGVTFTLIISGFNDQLKRKVKDKTTELASAIQQLKKADHVKNEFIANMSHEIRTPLNVVLTTLQLLKQSKQAVKERELIESALSSGRTLLAIINDILDVSKLEAGKLEIENTEFDLEKLVLDTINEQATIAETKGLNLSVNSMQPVEGVWYGDPTRIKQILINLINNSIKFTDTGKVEVNVSKYKQGVLFEITDTGIGMTQQQIDKLFDRFEQADSSTTRRFGGTGLGLAIVSQLIYLMNGSIEVSSELAKGAKFKVKLPLKHSGKKKLVQQDDDEQTMPNLTGKTILLAEDNKVNQMVFKAIITPANAELIIAENGQEAIALLETHSPEIIFMDIQMPIMDGEMACIKIRETNKEIPIVALTANVLESDVARYLAEGFDAHLAKPIEINKLIKVLSDSLA
ncbi:ATP-binding protein [Pseudoalteromonas sp. G4]|uniref:ATP-binding protein n=1 Tax=Pseudoalteromonas sp. G4 TaxID=2992761 RepID=UPI00237D7676|nr:ATP-binding protein [Pseudoalteromonas sp. G4]MDE3274316.1 ATP-binding protein [Pseudoalteromonas sp. G4]